MRPYTRGEAGELKALKAVRGRLASRLQAAEDELRAAGWPDSECAYACGKHDALEHAISDIDGDIEDIEREATKAPSP